MPSWIRRGTLSRHGLVDSLLETVKEVQTTIRRRKGIIVNLSKLGMAKLIFRRLPKIHYPGNEIRETIAKNLPTQKLPKWLVTTPRS